MTSAPALKCPQCRRSYSSVDWHDDRSGRCHFCLTDFEAIRFPALSRTKPAARPQAVVLAEDSTCFFHHQNQAEKVCDGCGRFLCAVCAVPSSGGTYCPACLSKQNERSAVAIPSRILYDSAALSLAFLPLLLWFFTLFTAPIALGLVIYGWNKPGSLVNGPRRWRLALAGLASLAQIGGWIFILLKLWLR
ncbi:hypothetical protein DB347_01290 [Opitutaceae bacterium EW11]|nr:hypothetical protein DB347_01290 [Opitutaceae bacterium EW11]